MKINSIIKILSKFFTEAEIKEILIKCSSNKMTTRECIKVDNLRNIYGQQMNFKKWLEDPDHVYVGHHGQINIKNDKGEMTLFNHKGSIWKNPYKLKDHTREECLSLYKDYITKKIKTDKKYDLSTLRGKKLGCWCFPNEECHADILLELINSDSKP